jgi:hypothetical protein
MSGFNSQEDLRFKAAIAAYRDRYGISNTIHAIGSLFRCAKNPVSLGRGWIAAGIAGTANRGNVSRGKGRKSSVLAVAVEVRSLVL